MSEEQPTVDVAVEEEQGPNLPGLLQSVDGAPTQEQIEQWKATHGEIYVSGFSETEMYVWRPINRPEWLRIQTLAADPKSELDQAGIEELVCDSCCLWKSTSTTWATGKAGTPQTLSEQIMQNSNFLSPAAASMLVAKL